ncbi:hypothetical protein KC887_09535, partial [Candidatus Kaiserbacteria bacterium]|nr:hypothetical protein [Candidatus Kaiserbacteria bacterium]
MGEAALVSAPVRIAGARQLCLTIPTVPLALTTAWRGDSTSATARTGSLPVGSSTRDQSSKRQSRSYVNEKPSLKSFQ